MRKDFLNIDLKRKNVIISPHDDDAIIGLGGVIQRMDNPIIIILTDGSLGYTEVQYKNEIVNIRKSEAISAYSFLGVDPSNIIFLNFPDLSLSSFKNWKTLDGSPGAYQLVIEILRRFSAENIFISSNIDPHPDHSAAWDIGIVSAEFAEAPVFPDYGKKTTIKSIVGYRVWEKPTEETKYISLNKDEGEEKYIALQQFSSQKKFIKEINSYNKALYTTEELFFIKNS